MITLLLTTALLFGSFLGLTQAQGNSNFVDGKGQILVFNGSDITNPLNYLGCMAADGAFVLKDCAFFTKADYSISSSLGNCTWHDDTKQENKDSIYGGGSYAWSCGKQLQTDGYYSFQTTKSYPIICHNNLDCFVDVRDIPKTAKDRFPLWEFRWGSQEWLAPGHTQAMFWWSAVDKH